MQECKYKNRFSLTLPSSTIWMSKIKDQNYKQQPKRNKEIREDIQDTKYPTIKGKDY